MKVQIVVPAINLWEKYSKPCIESINTAMVRADQHGIPTRLLFIDNASTDETKDEAGKMVSNVFCHHRNEERWGFQKSVNYGVKDAFERGFDIVLVCNNDIIMHPEAIWRLVDAFGKTRTLTGDAENAEPMEVETGMITCMDIRGEMNEKGIPPREIERLLVEDKIAVDEAPYPNFSAFAVTKSCWDQVGEFDELFAPAYFEDNDFHYRMKLEALLAVVCPTAMFYHYGSSTQREASEDGKPMVPSPMFEKNRTSYALKWGGMPGEEKYDHPYNEASKTVRSTKQNP